MIEYDITVYYCIDDVPFKEVDPLPSSVSYVSHHVLFLCVPMQLYQYSPLFSFD